MKYWNSFRFFFCTSMKVHVKCQFFLYLIICVPKNHHCDFLEVTRELTLQLFCTDGNSHRKKRRRMQYLNDVLLPGKNLSSMSGGNLFRIGLSATCVGKCFWLAMQNCSVRPKQEFPPKPKHFCRNRTETEPKHYCIFPRVFRF